MSTKDFSEREHGDRDRSRETTTEEQDDLLFEVLADASPEQVSEAVELMLAEPWQTGADAPFEHRIDDITITSSDDVDLHEIELLRSPDFFDDPNGEHHAVVLERAEPVANAMEHAAREAWGEPFTVQVSDAPPRLHGP